MAIRIRVPYASFLYLDRLSACVLVCLLFPACGRVNDPLPPLVSVPAAASDLSVEQVGYELRLAWTNPARNVDQSTATDLAFAFVEAQGVLVSETEVSGPGQRQTLTLPAEELVGSQQELTVHFQTERGRISGPSNRVSVDVVEVPGPVADIEASVDQDRVTLEWVPPPSGGDLVDGYRVYRSGALLSDTPVLIPRYVDVEFEPEASYAYVVVGLRALGGGWVEGLASEPLSVRVLDSTPPGPPTGLSLTAVENGVFLVWRTNPESDVVRYQVFRRSVPDGSFIPLTDEPQATTGFTDSDYEPGYAYRVLAIDRSGNQSTMSDPIVGP